MNSDGICSPLIWFQKIISAAFSYNFTYLCNHSSRMGQIILFSLFPQDLTKIFPQSQRSANDWLIFPLPSPGQWNITYQNPIPPGETTTLNGTGTPESRSMRRISVTQLFLPSLAKHLFLAIHHKRPSPRPWCASDSVHSRVWMMGGGGWDWGSKPLHILARREETTW